MGSRFIESTWFRIAFQFVIIIGVSVIVVRSCVKERNDYDIIRENYKIVSGQIINYSVVGVSRRGVDYEYFVNKEKYNGGIVPSHQLPCEVYGNCIGKKYDVIYSVEYPEKSYLLVEAYGYHMFDLPIPNKYKD